MTCLTCGFLALGDREVGRANRDLLAASGEDRCPPLDKLHCTKSLWVDYELGYFDDSRDGVFAELEKRRRPCEGFFRYRPGCSPSGHQDLVASKQQQRERIMLGAGLAVGGVLLTLITKWVLKYLGL